MQIASTIITIALVLVAILLIITVLLQKTKSAGMGSAFGGDTQSFTARGKAASREAKLQKATIILAVIMGALAIVLSMLS